MTLRARETTPEGLTLTIPLVPVSVNRYVRHTRNGRHYVTSEAEAFKAALAVIAAGRKVEAREYAVSFTIYLGKGQRGDLANFEKLIGDGLQDAGVIHSDDAIVDYEMHKRRDSDNPRTEITVEGKV